MEDYEYITPCENRYITMYHFFITAIAPVLPLLLPHQFFKGRIAIFVVEDVEMAIVECKNHEHFGSFSFKRHNEESQSVEV